MSCARLSLTRVLFGLAGTMTLAAVVLAVAVSPWFLLSASSSPRTSGSTRWWVPAQRPSFSDARRASPREETR